MKSSNHDDTFYMKYAIRLASRNIGLTGENPSVACLLVCDGKIISQGITEKGGSPHAEFIALSKLTNIPPKTIAYVTLEPCSFVGKNPSCASLLIDRGISKVVIATKDPNPLVNGVGIEILEKKGLNVIVGLEELSAKENIYGFEQKILGSYPEVNIKVASYQNGITIPDQKEPWITNSLSRSYGHILRSNHDVIIVGVNTVKIDNPNLDCRLPGMIDRSPIKVIIDTNLTTPLNCSLVKNANKNGLIIFTSELNNNNNFIKFLDRGVEVIRVDTDEDGLLNVKSVLDTLREKGFNRILVEGGSTLSSSFLSNNLVNFVYWFKSDNQKNDKKPISNGDKTINKIIKSSKFKIKDSISLKSDSLKIFKSV